MKIAVIGTGISGLVTAYLLHRKHDITVFEANARIGGHTHSTVKHLFTILSFPWGRPPPMTNEL